MTLSKTRIKLAAITSLITFFLNGCGKNELSQEQMQILQENARKAALYDADQLRKASEQKRISNQEKLEQCFETAKRIEERMFEKNCSATDEKMTSYQELVCATDRLRKSRIEEEDRCVKLYKYVDYSQGK